MEEYKVASYGLRRAVMDAKRKYRDRVEAHMAQHDTRRLWQGLRTITDYQGRTASTVSADASLADDLDSFYVWFEASNNTTSRIIAEMCSIVQNEHTLSVTEHDVRRALMRVDVHHNIQPLPG